MAIACPIGFDTQKLRDEVRAVYSRVAESPDGTFHFHRGAEYASRFLGYDLEELKALPPRSTASFAGMGNPHSIGPIREGETVLDVGCGVGMDLLLAAKRVGPTGRAHDGIDAPAGRRSGSRGGAPIDRGDTRRRCRVFARRRWKRRRGDIERSSEPRHRQEQGFSEIWRVLVPGGRLLLADIVVEDDLSKTIRNDIELWTG